jgi:hypothetical protein
MNRIDDTIAFEIAKFCLDNNCDSEGFRYIWKDILNKMIEIESRKNCLVSVVDYVITDVETGRVLKRGTKLV